MGRAIGVALEEDDGLSSERPSEQCQERGGRVYRAGALTPALSRALPRLVTIGQEAGIMYKRILVPIDGSPASKLSLNEAIKLAKDQGAKLRLFHLVDEYIGVSSADGVMLDTSDLLESLRQGGKKIIEKAEALARRNGLTPESVMIESFGGRAADFIVEQANKWRADLIVLGTHGRRGVKRLVMGSDAEHVVRTTRVPVLLVRSKETPRASRKA